MKICWPRFNTYLAVFVALITLCGCHTDKSHAKAAMCTLRLHQEMRPDPLGSTEQASVFRENPVMITVGKEPFLTEKNVTEAKLVEALGGFAVSIQFDREGSWLLEEYTAASRGKHILIYCQFMNPNDDKINKGRWLAAPKIQTHITNGLLIFTPDASREEAQQIVSGLNNVAKKLETGQEPKW
jgi:preprotein translocase subunit SecD